MKLDRLTELKNKVIDGKRINKKEALEIWQMPLEELCSAANEIRKHFCGDSFDICTIINGKSGRCSEDCKYCAQSAIYKAEVEEYSLKSKEELLEQAKYNAERGVLRYSIVTSGKRLSDRDVDLICQSIKMIKKETNISVCISLGLLDEIQFRKLKKAGAKRVHNNLETSKKYFPNVCTTHSYEEKIKTIKAAKKAGLSVCSGGIIGLGETAEDRIDMVMAIRELGVKSIPINILNPIKGTPYELEKILNEDEVKKTVAVFRFLMPDSSIRLAGGRGLMSDMGEKCFLSGANAAISGNMLTTDGITIEKDMKMLKKLGYRTELQNE